MSSQHDFITYSHTASGLKHSWMWSHRRRLLSSVNTAFTHAQSNPHRSDLHRFTRTSNACMCQQHDMCPHLTCDWLLRCTKESSFNKSPKTKHSQNETYWTAGVRALCVVCSQNQEQQRRSFTLQTLSRTDRSATQEAAQDLPAVFISQGVGLWAVCVRWVCSAVSH